MNLKESNRWVKKAQTIPWPEIEKRYAALFTNCKGNVAKPLHLALGACIIQAEYGYSDEETGLRTKVGLQKEATECTPPPQPVVLHQNGSNGSVYTTVRGDQSFLPAKQSPPVSIRMSEGTAVPAG